MSETNNLGELSDEDLIRRLVEGCDEAFSVLFDRYSRLVMSIAIRILHDQGEAEEVAQSVFFDAYRAAVKFDKERGTVKIWLLQFAYHQSMRRKQQLTARHFYDAEPVGLIVERMMAYLPQNRRRLPPQETVRLINEALSLLNDKQRRVIELTYFEGLTAKEIAAATEDSRQACQPVHG